jgi:integrase
MRSSEAWNLKWKDVDFGRNTITLNETLKHGNPRMFKVSSKLTAMLNALPKNSETHIFQRPAYTPWIAKLQSQFQKPQEESSPKNAESKHKQNQLPHFPTLVRNNGIPQNKEADTCLTETGA